MEYFSTNRHSPLATLSEAVSRGLAPDGGLYMPQRISRLQPEVIEQMPQMTNNEVACAVADALFGEDIAADLHAIVNDALAFNIPVVRVDDNISVLELFHGPTLAFKDVGARFMARLMAYFLKGQSGQTLNVLVATSGDTGSAVANGFLGVEGINVYVLYPKGRVSRLQESQFATLGQNTQAIAVDGSFDDCQALVKQAFMDSELNAKMRLTSANSINVARFLPQSFYYFMAYAQLRRAGLSRPLVVSVPSGNFGNLAAGLVAWQMGLPVERFIAANNRNSEFTEYLQTGHFEARPSVRTLANAMDVGNPSNLARIDCMFGGDIDKLRRAVSGHISTDDDIRSTIKRVYKEKGYMLDPHGACAYQALAHGLREGEAGLFLETAHPAKFQETMAPLIGSAIPEPQQLKRFENRKVLSANLSNKFADIKQFLLERQ